MNKAPLPVLSPLTPSPPAPSPAQAVLSFADKGAQKFVLQFEQFLKKYLKSFSCLPFKGHRQLKSALEYSLFSGGKRFRPLLIFAVARILKIPPRRIFPFAGAVEMIHTASLIHDDLPCMDNSPQRRNKPSCWNRYGESTAVLAGDCLWIEAFRLLIISKAGEVPRLLTILTRGAGFHGLMGGQALDLNMPLRKNPAFLQKMQSMKTGALIQVCVEGTILLKPPARKKNQQLKKAGELIGLAFQLSDDLQDLDQKESSNRAQRLGKKKARKSLDTLTRQILKLIDFKEPTDSLLKKLVVFNRERSFEKTYNG